MPLVHVLRNSSYVGRSKRGRFATVSKENGAWGEELFSDLELALKTRAGTW